MIFITILLMVSGLAIAGFANMYRKTVRQEDPEGSAWEQAGAILVMVLGFSISILGIAMYTQYSGW